MRWEGYGDTDDTWEPADNLLDPQLLEDWGESQREAAAEAAEAEEARQRRRAERRRQQQQQQQQPSAGSMVGSQAPESDDEDAPLARRKGPQQGQAQQQHGRHGQHGQQQQGQQQGHRQQQQGQHGQRAAAVHPSRPLTAIVAPPSRDWDVRMFTRPPQVAGGPDDPNTWQWDGLARSFYLRRSVLTTWLQLPHAARDSLLSGPMAQWAEPLDACSPRCGRVCIGAHAAREGADCNDCLLLVQPPTPFNSVNSDGRIQHGDGIDAASMRRRAVLAEGARARLRTHGLKGLIVKVRSTQSNGRYVLAEVQAISRSGIMQLAAPGFVAEMAHTHVSDSDLSPSEVIARAPGGIPTTEACERWQLLHLLEFVHDAAAQRRARGRAVAAEVPRVAEEAARLARASCAGPRGGGAARKVPPLVPARAALGGGGGSGGGGGAELELQLVRGSEAERTYGDGAVRDGRDGAARLGAALIRAWDPRRPSGGLLGMMSLNN